MSIGLVGSILMAIIGVAGLTVFLTSANTASIVKTFGSSFTSALGTAMGR